MHARFTAGSGWVLKAGKQDGPWRPAQGEGSGQRPAGWMGFGCAGLSLSLSLYSLLLTKREKKIDRVGMGVIFTDLQKCACSKKNGVGIFESFKFKLI